MQAHGPQVKEDHNHVISRRRSRHSNLLSLRIWVFIGHLYAQMHAVSANLMDNRRQQLRSNQAELSLFHAPPESANESSALSPNQGLAMLLD
jgi:ethanolamine utilization microcompartment shell protein EutL